MIDLNFVTVLYVGAIGLLAIGLYALSALHFDHTIEARRSALRPPRENIE